MSFRSVMLFCGFRADFVFLSRLEYIWRHFWGHFIVIIKSMPHPGAYVAVSGTVSEVHPRVGLVRVRVRVRVRVWVRVSG